MEKYRIFLSYSHEDIALVEKIVNAIEMSGLTAMWDQKFSYGHGFPEQIKTFIAYSHVFLPVITEAANKRGWVHQEIGYAIALQVPVLPVIVGALPPDMIRELHGYKLGSDEQELQAKLPRKVFDDLVNSCRDTSVAPYVCAELHEDRASMMAKYANEVLNLGASGMVRQKGGLSSFHIPEKPITNPVWQLRLGSAPKNEFRCRLLREERVALGKLAMRDGCCIVVNPSIAYEEFGKAARLVRLQTLLGFLESVPNEKAQVAFSTGMDREENVTIVGDWFAAVAVSRSNEQGYRQTMFTRHAPSMQTRIDLFDAEFEGLLQYSGWRAESSREKAIAGIETIVADLKNELEGKKKPTGGKPPKRKTA